MAASRGVDGHDRAGPYARKRWAQRSRSNTPNLIYAIPLHTTDTTIRTYNPTDIHPSGHPRRTPTEDAKALAAFMATHSDEALHGPEIAAKRARQRAALPKPTRPRRLTPSQFARAWREGGVGPIPDLSTLDAV